MTQELSGEVKHWMTVVLEELSEINAGIGMLIKEQNSKSPEIIDKLVSIQDAISEIGLEMHNK